MQKNARTVQGIIEEKLRKILKINKVNLIGSGRTDAGVHANEQIANVSLETNMTFIQIKNALNSILPKDVYINDCRETDDQFNARFSAKKREYIYYIIDDYSPTKRMYYWQCKWSLNEQKLNKCASMIIGEKKFSLLSKASSETKNKICNIYESSWIFNKGYAEYRIVGNRFLQHMVRLLVGTMIEVSRNRIPVKDFNKMLQCKDTNYTSVRAPALGLFLNKIYYE